MPPKSKFQKSDRVILGGNHSQAGERGTIATRPGALFHGWTVQLDNGTYVGAATSHMTVETTDEGGLNDVA